MSAQHAEWREGAEFNNSHYYVCEYEHSCPVKLPHNAPFDHLHANINLLHHHIHV